MRIYYLITIGLALFFLPGCEKEITVDLPEGEQHIVVESHVENGKTPYVILTRDQSYFSKTDLSTLQDLFVKNADVWITNYSDTVKLRQITSNDLPQGIDKQYVADIFQLQPEDIKDYIELVFYTIPPSSAKNFKGKIGEEYKLIVNTPDYNVSATTKIIPQAQLDSLYYQFHEEQEDFARVFINVDDPLGIPKYYRYMTKRNSEAFYSPVLGSVASDEAIDGRKFNFPISRAYPRTTKIDEDEPYGLFRRGDTVIVKLCALDREHYKFWSTLEADFRNQGNPFGSPTIIQSNINGGIGIFGGYSCDYDTVIIK